MHVHHRTWKRGPHHAVDDGLCARKAPVPRVYRVAHRGQPTLSDLVKHGGIPGIVGRPHARRGLARERADLVLGLVDFVRELRHRNGGQVRVRPGVVLDRVAGGGEHPCVLRILEDVLPDLEERGRHVVALENRENRRRVGPRTIVEGEGDDLLSRGGRATRGLVRVESRVPGLGGRHRRRPKYQHGRTGNNGSNSQDDPDHVRQVLWHTRMV